jgi:hypothetical protein
MNPASQAAAERKAGVRTGTLAMTLVVRDEEDILETNLRYHLAQGVDFIYALDHNSTDATPDILRSFEQMGVLRMLREGGDVHDQAPRVTRLARLAHDELRADWVINNDADEFWWPAVGDLKDLLCAIPEPFDVLVARRHNFIPRADGAGVAFQDRMLWRHAESRTPTGQLLEPKVAHRGDHRVVVAPGNHYIQAPAFTRAPPLPLVEVLHFPARDYQQFVRKTLHTGRGYELLPGRDPTIGVDQLRLLGLHRRGELRDYFDRWANSDEEMERGVSDGSIVRDVRLRDYLARAAEGSTTADIHDRQQVRDVVAGALRLNADLLAALDAEVAADRAQAAAARAAERSEAEARIAGRDEKVAELYHALEQVRNSRLMRSTRSLRRLYYRLK